LLDGAHGGQTGVSVLRDGKMLGGGSVKARSKKEKPRLDGGV